MKYAETDTDGNVVHVCEVYRADDITPKQPKGARFTALPDGVDAVPGRHKIDKGRVVERPENPPSKP